MSDAVRLAHFSDVHLSARPMGWKRRDLISKRVTGWFNMRVLGRAWRFRHAERVAEAMMRHLRAHRPDHLVFSGDATALAFEREFAVAAKRLGVGDPALPPALAVPGNHDAYVAWAVHAELFEKYFGSWQHGTRIDGSVYPFAQRVGPVWLVGVNSASANFWTWDASGRIGAEQRERLRRLLKELSPGPRILVTHYPLALANGKPEPFMHALRDGPETVKVAADGGVVLWLHGHKHGSYRLAPNDRWPFPVICAGSATQTKRWSFNEYVIAGRTLTGTRFAYHPAEDRFAAAETFEFKL